MNIETVKTASRFSIPIKIILAGIVSALGGSGYIGFLSEYATYFYALSNGFRIPAEGSPYLKVTIASISFSAMLLCAIIYMIFYFIVKINLSSNKWANKVQRKIVDSFQLKSQTPKAIHWLYNTSQKPMSITGAIVASFISSIAVAMMPYFWVSKVIPIPIYLFLFFVSFTYFICASLPLIDRKYFTTACTFTTLFYLVSTPLFLFNGNVYGAILKEIKYGGGTRVTIHFEDKKEINTKLLLRTSDSIFITDGDDKVSEIPLGKINKITY
ncbi:MULTISPECIES: hypothetical protein [Serratia]|uniref:hypothetical protein n=2 Tax=Serratia TaxID=613 RepID=UPI0011AB3255|nr:MULTISPECIES: hypothetical protein [Serratia]MBL0903477.1 hypothetical protein [Serratia bockelmannii]